jgi:hypothetical protein
MRQCCGGASKLRRAVRFPLHTLPPCCIPFGESPRARFVGSICSDALVCAHRTCAHSERFNSGIVVLAMAKDDASRPRTEETAQAVGRRWARAVGTGRRSAQPGSGARLASGGRTGLGALQGCHRSALGRGVPPGEDGVVVGGRSGVSGGGDRPVDGRSTCVVRRSLRGLRRLGDAVVLSDLTTSARDSMVGFSGAGSSRSVGRGTRRWLRRSGCSVVGWVVRPSWFPD